KYCGNVAKCRADAIVHHRGCKKKQRTTATSKSTPSIDRSTDSSSTDLKSSKYTTVNIQCSINKCPQKFALKSALNSHKHRVHPEFINKCLAEQCGESFYNM